MTGRPGKWTDYAQLLDAKWDKNVMQVSLKVPTTRHMDDFLALRCAPDLLSMGLYPNAKEITESMACFRAAVRGAGFDVRDPDVRVYVVGDGVTPRTAALFAFRTKWDVHSVDPHMMMLHYTRHPDNIRAGLANRLVPGDHWMTPDVQRLRVYAHVIEDVEFPYANRVVVVMPHSHADVDVTLNRTSGRERCLVAMPCCDGSLTKLIGRQPPDVEYDDWGVWSPERRVMVWRRV